MIEHYDGSPKEQAFMGGRKIEQCAVSNMTTDQAIQLGIDAMARLRELINESGGNKDQTPDDLLNLYLRLERAEDKLDNLKESRT